MRVAVSVNRALVVIVLLLSFPLLLDLKRLPDSIDVQEWIFAALTPCHDRSECSLCGEVLEMVDMVQRALVDPFTEELTLTPAEWDPHTLRSYQRCLQQPLQRGCDALLQKVRSQQIEFARLILEQVLDDVHFQTKWGLLGEDYVIRTAVRLTTYIFDSQEPAFGGLVDQEQRRRDGAAASRKIVYQHSTLSLGGDPEVESLVSRVWFLRRDVLPLHQDFCYAVCEGRLGFLRRLWLAVARFYIRHGVKTRLLLLRQHHRGTLLVLELMMIGLAFCVERMMRVGTPWSSVAVTSSYNGGSGGSVLLAVAGGSGGVNKASSAGPSSSAHIGGPGHSSSGGGAKSHYRQGRRR